MVDQLLIIKKEEKHFSSKAKQFQANCFSVFLQALLRNNKIRWKTIYKYLLESWGLDFEFTIFLYEAKMKLVYDKKTLKIFIVMSHGRQKMQQINKNEI